VHGGLAMDKKISELTVMQTIDPADVSILVHNNTDYRFTFATLLNYISSNLSTGASITFGSNLPQNNSGKNGDIFINTSASSFAQKISGIWIIVYTLPSGEPADGTLVYGLGSPNSTNGKNGDTYIDTATGIFYKKTAGYWSLVFTMLNGPAGVKGDKGDTGARGTNGNTVLNGTVNPSNQTTGTDGDFYIKTNTWELFGPKTAGVWPVGVPMVQTDEVFYTKVQIDALLAAHEPHTYAYDAPLVNVNSFTIENLINMSLIAVYRSGMRFNIINSGTPMGNSVLFNSITGQFTFAENFSTDFPEQIYIDFKSASFDPTIPTGNIIDGNG
jgi:hypothetical protein